MANSIIYFQFANIGTNPIAVVFLSDGSIEQSNTTTKVVTQIAPPGTILNPSTTLPLGVTQWGSQYVLICAPQANGYFLWDGTVFYQAGTIGPQVDISDSGFGYTSPPTITATGGAGNAASFTATITSSGN